MTPLRKQYVGLLTLSGYSQRTHESYIGVVAALARHYRRPPDQLSDEQVRDYLLGLHQRGLSRSAINVETGIMKGMFTPYWENASSKNPAFQGVILLKGANQGGWGYFLGNQKGDLDPESGIVTFKRF